MEISISIEETNRLRKQIGLPLIQILRGAKTGTREDDSTHLPVTTKDTRKTGSNKSYNSSLSIEETNKLRAQVGLPLIPLEDGNGFNKFNEDLEYSNYQKLQSKQDKLCRVEDFKQRLQQTKDELKNRKLKESATLLDNAENDTRTDEEWLSTLGKKMPKNPKYEKKNRPVRISEPEHLDDLTIKHDHSNFTEVLQSGNEVVLTLKDKSVYDNDISEDELENQNLKENFKIQESLKERAKKKKVDIEEEFKNANFNGYESSGIREGSFKLNDMASHQLTTNNTTKEKKKRKLIVFDDGDDDDDSELETKSDYHKVSKKKFKKLKKSQIQNQRAERPVIEINAKELKTVELINDDLEGDDNSELSNFITVTRRKKQQTRKIEDLIADDDTEDIKPVKSSNGGLVIDEEMEFINTIKLNEDNGNAKIQTTNLSETQQRQKNLGDDEDEDEQSYNSDLANFMYADPASQMTSSMGLSHTLKLLKGEEKGSSEKKPSDGKSIKLTYHDDEGNELDIKGAFKYQSQKFHGFKKRR